MHSVIHTLAHIWLFMYSSCKQHPGLICLAWPGQNLVAYLQTQPTADWQLAWLSAVCVIDSSIAST